MSGDDDLITISAAADAIGINKSTLSRQVKAGLIRSHDGKVRLSEVIADRDKNLGAARSSKKSSAPAPRAAPSPVASLHEPVACDAPVQRATPCNADDATPIGDALELISISAAAKAIGINKSTLKRQIDTGAIRSHGGKVRLIEVLEDRAKNIDLTRSSKDRKKKRSAAGRSDPSAEDEVLQLEMVLVDGKLLPFAEAQRLRENYAALAKRLDYLIKSGAVVDRQAAETLFFQISREGRDAWLNWAPRVSVLMAADLNIDASLLSETLARYVQQHLGELGEPVSPQLLAANGQPPSSLAARADASASPDGP